MTNPERRDAGLAYVGDRVCFEEMAACKRKLKKLNELDQWEHEKINQAAREVIPDSKGLFIISPFYCEYGTHIHVGRNLFLNYNCVLIDVAPITIGDNVMFGPNVAVYTAGHPVHPETRNSGYEYGRPVTIGDNVWVGGSAVILPGVHIGSNVVIGAGSVVTHDIPDMVVAAGNPCRVLRQITDEDRRSLFRQEPIDDEAWAIITGQGSGT